MSLRILNSSFYQICQDVTDNNKDRFHQPYLQKLNIMNERYHCESERRKSFQNWPLRWLNADVLARTGMFYTGDSDKVKCYFCEVEIGCWEETDEIVPEHLRWSPNCPLLRRRTTNNVPINAEQLDAILPPISYDICGANDTIHPPTANTIPNTTSSLMTDATPAAHNHNNTASCSSNNAATSYFPMYPEYAIESARLRSFADWPRNMKQRPQQLAEAGFFYIGVGDRVKCFTCGGGLKDWNDSDEPWEQHALWLGKCRFLKLLKGENYIDSIVERFKNQEAAEKAAANEQRVPLPGGADNEETSSNSDDGEAAKINTIQTDVAKSPLSSAITTSTSSNCDEGLAVVAAAAPPPTEIRKTTNDQQRNIPEEKLCKICYADEYNTAFLPCGHVVACAKCASSVTKCPLCRKPFTDIMRVYFS